MNAIKPITVGVALLLLAGCATTFRPWKLSEVKEGMARKQVIATLGEPDSVEMTNGIEILHYSYNEDYNPPTASGLANQSVNSPERQIQDQQIKRSIKEHKYAVKLVDGKVQDYKELND
jgi:outer membrane protein assembly factor BamE (lipoprotein component of BamABCDE complex)